MELLLIAALQLIDNVLTHEGPPPLHAPAMVRELLAHPLEAQDAKTLFRRAVPPQLVELVQRPPQAESMVFNEVITLYINELNAIHK